MNEELTYHVLQQAVNLGTREFILCAGSRNSSFVEALRLDERLTTYYWPEERSGAFFALGRCRALAAPVAIITTSGTAAGELLPAAMEAHYSGVPLILITADRPKRFRGSGAPQSAEQVGLFGHYVKHCYDIAPDTHFTLEKWDRNGPVHLNVCLEEPQKQPKFQGRTLAIDNGDIKGDHAEVHHARSVLTQFFSQVERPLAIVSTLAPHQREAVATFLLRAGIPAMIEAISGLRNDARLAPQSIRRTGGVLDAAAAAGYPIDGVLRIGGVPTHRIWRDLESLEDQVKVCSLSELPFSGLSWSRRVAQGPINAILKDFHLPRVYNSDEAAHWLKEETSLERQLETLFHEEPLAEASLLRQLSHSIPQNALVYLGNSLPIREWDMAAVREDKGWDIGANRGVNGIDGQISTFLGMSRAEGDNWGIVGDLTALYDLAGCWVVPQLDARRLTLVVVNNGGGMLFKRMYPYREMLNAHALSFRPLAEMWGFEYQCVKSHDQIKIGTSSKRLIELIPDAEATERFWKKYHAIEQCVPARDLAKRDGGAMRVHTLHGFLGGRSDWHSLVESLRPHHQVECYDLLAEELSVSLDVWGKTFNAHAKRAPDAQNLLVGYSLGGRLALHALCADPDRWSGAVIVSAHPGLRDDASKNARLLSDEAWAARIESEPWSQWIGDWNSQPVFRHDPPHHAVPLAAERCRLFARALRRWSLGAQHDLFLELDRVETPVLWIVGEKDEGYLKVAEKVRLKHPLSRVVKIEGAGHRIPWSQPETFNREVEQFIKSVEESR